MVGTRLRRNGVITITRTKKCHAFSPKKLLIIRLAPHWLAQTEVRSHDSHLFCLGKNLPLNRLLKILSTALNESSPIRARYTLPESP